jgi:hypothetical protein
VARNDTPMAKQMAHARKAAREVGHVKTKEESDGVGATNIRQSISPLRVTLN